MQPIYLALLSLAVFLGTLVACIAARRYSREDKLTHLDLLIAIAAVGVVLMSLGIVGSLEIGFKGVVIKALERPPNLVTVGKEIPVERLFAAPAIDAAGKATDASALLDEQLADLKSEKYEAINFPMNKINNPGAVRKLFGVLARMPSFKYLIITQSNGKFFGIISARDFLRWWHVDEVKHSEEFEAWITHSSKAHHFSDIPGFITESLRKDSSKAQALATMTDSTNDYSFLPVVDEGVFVGLADRSRIVASILVDINRALGGDSQR
jgi:CBS domain-containing protein